MKIGVISDTHIPTIALDLPPKVFEYFRGVDLILHAGDLVTIDVIEQLKKITPRVEAVYGNMDDAAVHSLLPKKKIITAGDYRIGLIHGWGGAEKLPEVVKKEFNNVQVIVFGHSHRPMNEKKNGVLLFNPGSPTDTAYTGRNSIGILDVGATIKGTIIPL